MNSDGQADERDIARLDRSVSELSAAFEAEIRRLDQVIALGEKGVNVALVAAEKAVTAALAAADKATDKAEKNTEDSFQKVNEFRGSLDDLSRQMATRRELEDFKEVYRVAHEALRGQVVEQGRRIDLAPELRAVTARVDVGQGAQSGAAEKATAARANVALWIAAASVALVLFGVLGYSLKASPAVATKCYDAHHVLIVCP